MGGLISGPMCRGKVRDSKVHIYDGRRVPSRKWGVEIAGPMGRLTWGDHCAHFFLLVGM